MKMRYFTIIVISFVLVITGASNAASADHDSPLHQFNSGILAKDISCKEGLVLVIKAEAGSPACIKQDSVVKLIQRGWMSVLFQDPTGVVPVDSYQAIENNSGIISIKNQTYYIMTATNTTYPVDPMLTVQFHKVIFSFPYGALATPGGVILPFDMTFPDGTTQAYGKITQNQDGSGMLSGMYLGPGPSSNRTDTGLSNHLHPQAGMIMTEDKIKLLVSTDTDSITQASDIQNYDPFGITALVIYHPPDTCLNLVPPSNNTTVHGCPSNTFYLKINSNSTAYLLGYNICDGNSCAKSNNLSVLLPINVGLKPDYQMIGLPVNLPWKYGDAANIQLEVSSTLDNKTAMSIDVGNSTIVP